jgi:hypothetical protein
MIGLRAGKKDNSGRRFPGIGGCRHNPVGIKARRADAKLRNEAWQKLSLHEQLKALDTRFGTGLGATKQRAKIELLIEKQKNKPQVSLKESEQGTNVKAKDRRAAEQAKRPSK